MKQSSKKLLVFSLFTFFALIFIVGLVSAQTPGETAKSIFDPIKQMFTDWTGGNLSKNIAKYLFLPY